jgi:hypothetical protein
LIIFGITTPILIPEYQLPEGVDHKTLKTGIIRGNKKIFVKVDVKCKYLEIHTCKGGSVKDLLKERVKHFKLTLFYIASIMGLTWPRLKIAYFY